MYNDILEYHLYNILKKYFSTLENTGYVNNDIVDSIMTLVGIEELINNTTSIFVTVYDYKAIQNVVECCLTGDCLLPPMRTDAMYLGGAYKSSFTKEPYEDLFFIPDYETAAEYVAP